MKSISPVLFVLASLTCFLLFSESNAGTFTAHNIFHENISRSYIKFVPSGIDGPVPLVFALHGGNGSAAKMAGPGSPWRELTVLAERDKFIVVYPNGLNGWNDCRSDDLLGSTADDVGFIDALITTISSEHTINPRRVYATGTSNGGMMSWRLAFELSNRIAAVAPNIANLPVDPVGECRSVPDRPISVAFMIGDQDSLMPFEGGVVAYNPQRGTVQSVQATLDFWKNFLSTATQPVATVLPNLNQDDSSIVIKYEYRSLITNRINLTYYRVYGGGHTTPSVSFPITAFGTGSQNRDVETVNAFWNFMRTKLLQ